MSLSGDFVQYQRWDMFHFYETENGTNGALSTSINNTALETYRRWKFQELRMHFSTAFASVEDLVIRISSTLGSNHNVKILSQAMNAIQDIHVYYSDPIVFYSDDQMVITMSMASGVNKYGLQVIGWAVRG